MPTATEKPVKKSTEDAEDPMKTVLIAVDRKVINLEKKKAKLESLKQRLAHGDELEALQKEAIARYDQIIHNLEFAQELQKQFEAISNEAERLLKKKLKKERMEKRVMEMRRVQELIELQSLLDSLGSETVRSDLQTGKNGAVVFTEENLKQLDEFYQLICPSRDGNLNYREQTMDASIHLVNLLDSSHKEIVGSTYKQIKELLTLLNNCGYFEKSNVATEAAEKNELEVDEEDASTASAEKEEAPEIKTNPEPVEITQPVEPEIPTPVVDPLPEPTSAPVTEPVPNSNPYYKPPAPIEEPKERPLQDIVTQGNFNFLQDSMLEFESAAHTDPAIVAVQLPNQPMTRPLASQNDSQQQAAAAAYGNSAYTDQPHYNDDGYMGQTDQSWASSSAYTAEESLYQENMMGNQGSNYPHNLNEEGVENDGKKFTMNAKAPVFTSMYSQGGDVGDSQNNKDQSYQGNQNDGYRGNRGYNNNYRGRNGRGGSDSGNQNGYSRGRGGRGGNYQGYQARNDYRSDGYQGYNNYNKSVGYQGRGGGSRGGGGGSRGGPPRGGNSRGNRGGFGRPQN